MYLHDDIIRITEADSIDLRFGLQDFALADLPAVTREMGLIPVESSVGEDRGSRLPGQTVDLSYETVVIVKSGQYGKGYQVVGATQDELKAKVKQTRTKFAKEVQGAVITQGPTKYVPDDKLKIQAPGSFTDYSK